MDLRRRTQSFDRQVRRHVLEAFLGFCTALPLCHSFQPSQNMQQYSPSNLIEIMSVLESFTAAIIGTFEGDVASSHVQIPANIGAFPHQRISSTLRQLRLGDIYSFVLLPGILNTPRAGCGLFQERTPAAKRAEKSARCCGRATMASTTFICHGGLIAEQVAGRAGGDRRSLQVKMEQWVVLR